MSGACRCPTCGKNFRSVAAFDRHRTGQHGINRRCRTSDEMLAIGMVCNARGTWVTAARPAATYAAS